ncbi:ABC transporter permease [Zunongwangia sp. HRR-M8]|uniref:ABC transporter permease n=1 Tax=Zunongwangia sp. HRR-M8 TaxID=3015170 RepID=UPI0022DE7D99|nr:FtsX-like permease family protein [Zunongwangia sp. HRR-M8]WBL21109.1 ABC transporter permease [Zunongwangia sp. HRR-M8]
MKQTNTAKPGFSWLLKMAWRDGKASKRKLLLFMASIVLGIAAVVSIQSFGENLQDNIALQSKSLMGADFTIDMNHPPNERVTEIMDSLGIDSREISFASMAAFPNKTGTKFISVRGIEGDYPFYGKLETQPASAAENYQDQNAALVDATVMLQLDLAVGDSIKIGEITLPILGELKEAPGSSSLFGAIAPPVIIPFEFIEKSGLIQTGSRIDYEYYFKADKNTDFADLDEKIGPQLDQEEADLDTHLSTSERLGKRYENFGKFLNLVAFIALLLGCVGIASAINIYIKEKLTSVAVLKCLGASKKQSFLIFLIQVAFIGLLSGIIGSILGVILQYAFPFILEGLLPIEIALSISYRVILAGIVLGILMSVLFALYPLVGTLYVSPLQVLRVQENSNSRSRKALIGISILIVLFLFLFSFWLLKDWKYSLSFIGGVLVTFAVLAGIAQLFINAIRKFFPDSWSFVSRQSLRNLFRPQNQTLILILAIGIGTFLISTLYFTKDLLLAQATLDNNNTSANMILLDVQSNQTKDIVETIKNQDLPVLEAIPIVTMRVQNLNGKSVNEIREDSTSTINRWILSHEFRVTYRDSLIASENIEGGEWIPEVKNTTATEVIPISVSTNFAEDAQVKVGDLVTFNIQGVLMKTKIASTRLVDWGRMQTNFSIVFPKGVLEKAPQFHVMTTQVPDAEKSAEIQQILVKKYPNVSILDLRQVLGVIEGLLNKISWIINFMAFFSILTGIIVLLGAVRTSKYQRIKESVLLRTIGAKSNQILKIAALEYIYLGSLGSLSGILLSLISSLLLAWLAFETTFIPSWIPFGVLFPGITILVLIIGLANSRSVIKNPPLQVLRRESV